MDKKYNIIRNKWQQWKCFKILAANLNLVLSFDKIG